LNYSGGTKPSKLDASQPTGAHQVSPNIPNAARLACLEKKSPPTGLPPTGYIRQSQLIPAIIPIAPATLWRWVLHGKFPKPVKLGANVTAWRCEDVRQWLDAKASAGVSA
jgi:prophage regulatory protein